MYNRHEVLQELAKRAYDIAERCARLAQTDFLPSITGTETDVLSRVTHELRIAAEAGKIRIETCIPVFDALLNAHEKILVERMAELEKQKQ